MKDRVSGGIFSYCPACGCAWPSPPPPATLDSIEGIEVYAPCGVTLPTRGELDAAGKLRAVQREVAYDEWRMHLEAITAAENA